MLRKFSALLLGSAFLCSCSESKFQTSAPKSASATEAESSGSVLDGSNSSAKTPKPIKVQSSSENKSLPVEDNPLIEGNSEKTIVATVGNEPSNETTSSSETGASTRTGAKASVDLSPSSSKIASSTSVDTTSSHNASEEQRSCDGKAIDATEEREIFETSTVPHGQTCKASGKQTRKCAATGWTEWGPKGETNCTALPAPTPSPKPECTGTRLDGHCLFYLSDLVAEGSCRNKCNSHGAQPLAYPANQDFCTRAPNALGKAVFQMMPVSPTNMNGGGGGCWFQTVWWYSVEGTNFNNNYDRMGHICACEF